ncbi:MAG: class I SAM-dependent methyltransferase [Frankiaceae bacterium]
MTPGDPLEVNRIFHDHECAYYDERFAIVHDRRSGRSALREAQRLLGRQLRRDETVLDVGCGTGWFAAGLRRAAPELRVIGADVSAGMLGRARAEGAWPLVQCDAGRLPLADATVDVVTCRGVLHHLPDVEGALAEWHRVLRPGGAVIVASEPTEAVERHGAVLVRRLLPLLHRPLTPEQDFWEVASMAANLHVLSATGLAVLARRAGYAAVELRTSGFAETLAMTASYVAQGRRPALRRLPWRALIGAGRALDAAVLDRALPADRLHTVTGALRA